MRERHGDGDGPIKVLQTATHPESREQAAEAPGPIHDPRALGLIIGALKDRDRELREEAAQAPGMIDNRRAVQPLNEAQGRRPQGPTRGRGGPGPAAGILRGLSGSSGNDTPAERLPARSRSRKASDPTGSEHDGFRRYQPPPPSQSSRFQGNTAEEGCPDGPPSGASASVVVRQVQASGCHPSPADLSPGKGKYPRYNPFSSHQDRACRRSRLIGDGRADGTRRREVCDPHRRSRPPTNRRAEVGPTHTGGGYYQFAPLLQGDSVDPGDGGSAEEKYGLSFTMSLTTTSTPRRFR